MIRKIAIIYFLLIILVGCNRTSEMKSIYSKDCNLLLPTLKNNFDSLAYYTQEYINILHGDNVDNTKLVINDLTVEEKAETKRSFRYLLNRHASNTGDSTVLDNRLVFNEITKKDTQCTRSNLTEEMFYTNILGLSEDSTIQYLRLFQLGKKERFDLLIRKNVDGEVELLAFG